MNYYNRDRYEGEWLKDEIRGNGKGVKIYENGD